MDEFIIALPIYRTWIRLSTFRWTSSLLPYLYLQDVDKIVNLPMDEFIIALPIYRTWIRL